MTIRKSTSLLVSLIAVAGLALTGCGKSEAPAAAPAVSADGVRTITITANDAMQFSVKEIEATAGESLRITLSNIGRMPKQAMSHNWVLLTPMSDGELNSVGMKASAKAPTYLPDDKSVVIANTKMLGSGETDTIEITVPSTPGEYPFICTFPGHFTIMRGKLIVK